MNASWIYRVGLGANEVSEDLLNKADLKYEKVVVENALRAHIDETLGKPYKLYTVMREDAPDFFSCSSLLSYLYLFAGVWIPSVVIDKYFYTKRIESKELRFGDFVFSFNEDMSGKDPLRFESFEYKPGEFKTDLKMNHMGMYLGDGKILQAAGYWYKGQVLIENIDESPSFKNIVGYGRVVEDLREERYVIEIPEDRPDLRNAESLLKEIGKYA